jgi:hypothetical protein
MTRYRSVRQASLTARRHLGFGTARPRHPGPARSPEALGRRPLRTALKPKKHRSAAAPRPYQDQPHRVTQACRKRTQNRGERASAVLHGRQEVGDQYS